MALLFTGFGVLAFAGAWQYATTRVEWRRERNRNLELAAQGFIQEEKENTLKTRMLTGAAMAVTGWLGLFAFIYRSTRKNNIPTRIKDLYKQKKP